MQKTQNLAWVFLTRKYKKPPKTPLFDPFFPRGQILAKTGTIVPKTAKIAKNR
jgi:hypothetical protein